MHPDGYAKTCSSEQLRCSSDLALMQFGSAPLTADLGGEPGGAHHALPRILKLVKTCSPLLVVISFGPQSVAGIPVPFPTSGYYVQLLPTTHY